ncbi:hypothetical protein FVEG_16781 [Fusarium verticillioides 7600]|uniref:Uncharacterized protein n=1 Tax=Gibberella moniliformis (strain M3125 / FGSC 7600) TaxID=334819 RepID=W7MU48_GIBM7|nr:hypothetical protein FVEG_16781 [Fusarium verticillioides 7600]EWG51299.1 hypothetical protein FVEG_16781 [Fusarium verticillioides 7600]
MSTLAYAPSIILERDLLLSNTQSRQSTRIVRVRECAAESRPKNVAAIPPMGARTGKSCILGTLKDEGYVEGQHKMKESDRKI